MRIALFDYGTGNLHSLGKAVEGAGARVFITRSLEEAVDADGLVLPGVGAFGQAAASLRAHLTPLRRSLEAGYPCLGVCLGMQILFTESEESKGPGLDFIPGRARILPASVVPQMGWNHVETSSDPLFRGIENLVAFYANSYVCEPEDDETAIAWSEYEGFRFVAGVRRANTWGVQFHPEKSSLQGRRVVANFVELARSAREGGP